LLSKKKILSLSAILSLFIGFVAIPNVHAQGFPTCPDESAVPGFSGPCNVSVSPSNTQIQSTSQLTFTVSVMINNVLNMSTYDLWFDFNPMILTANSIGVAPGAPTPTFWCQMDCGSVSTVIQEISQGAGTVHVVQGLKFAGATNVTSTPLILFTVSFTAKSPGTAALTIPTLDPLGSDNPKIAECKGFGNCLSFTASGYSNGVVVVPPFGISMVPGTLSLAQGSFATAAVTVASFFGFAGTVNVAASGSGINSTLSVRSVTLTANTNTSFSANVEAQPCTAAGSYAVGVTGTSGTMSVSNSLPVAVTSATVSGFCISASTNMIHVTAGTASSTTVTISVCSANGFNGAVSLTAVPFPIVHHRLKGALSLKSVTLASPANDCVLGTAVTDMLTINTTGSLAPGTYELVVQGSIGKTAGFFTVVTVVVS
jgi:hypothetical protein